MTLKNIFLLIAVLFTLDAYAQVVGEDINIESIQVEQGSSIIYFIDDEPDTGSWVEMEILDGCLDIEVDDEDGIIYTEQPNFRISLTDEQVDLNQELMLTISDGSNILLSGKLSPNMPTTPPIIFTDIALGIYTIRVVNMDETYECLMKISFKEVE